MSNFCAVAVGGVIQAITLSQKGPKTPSRIHSPDQRPLASVVSASVLPAPYFQLARIGSRRSLLTTYVLSVAPGFRSVATKPFSGGSRRPARSLSNGSGVTL